LKICIISTAHDARDDRLYYKQARSLAKKHEVSLIAPIFSGNQSWSDETVNFSRLNSGISKKARTLAALGLIYSIPYKKYDLIHISDIELMPLIPVIKRRTGAKIVYDIWEANYELILGPSDHPSRLRRTIASALRAVERAIAHDCDLVTTADSGIAEAFDSCVHTEAIYNYPLLPVPETSFSDSEALFAELGRKRFVIHVGSMSEERGTIAAIKMMSHVCKRHTDAALLLVGKIPNDIKSEICDVISGGGLKDNVVFVDWVDHKEIWKYLSIAEIGLVPFARTKKFEKNIPQKIFEYWATGIPVVGTDLKPMRHYFDICGGGILAARNDPEQMSIAVCTLLDRPELKREMGKKGLQMVEKEWRWDRMEKILLDIYETLDD
jgi:glycosyltransferase involved in cell wall biosynthesis